MVDRSIIRPLESFGQVQSEGFFRVQIPVIPVIGPTPELEFLVRQSSVPSIKRGTTLTRTLLGEYVYPDRIVFDHDWKVNVFLMEVDIFFIKLKAWFDLLDTMPLSSMKTKGLIQLVGIDGKTINKSITLNGIFPKNVPGVDTLTYDEGTGLVKMSVDFSVDSFEYS